MVSPSSESYLSIDEDGGRGGNLRDDYTSNENDFICFRDMFTPFLYPQMAIGLRLVHLIRALESGMPTLLHCSVSCMVMQQLCPLISVVSGIISLLRITWAK